MRTRRPERTSSFSITPGTSEPCTVRPTSFSFRPSRKEAPWSYEACGSGLPVVTTEMGAGTIVRNDREGYVIEPGDVTEWIAAIRRLAEDRQLRRRMSSAAAERAQSYVWPAVANRRRRQEGFLAACARDVPSEAEVMPGLSS